MGRFSSHLCKNQFVCALLDSGVLPAVWAHNLLILAAILHLLVVSLGVMHGNSSKYNMLILSGLMVPAVIWHPTELTAPWLPTTKLAFQQERKET